MGDVRGRHSAAEKQVTESMLTSREQSGTHTALKLSGASVKFAFDSFTVFSSPMPAATKKRLDTWSRTNPL